MPTLNACDFAYPPSDITIEEFYRRLYAAGVRVVQRYLWRGGKGVTPREILAAKNAGPDGIHIVYGYEASANSWRGGAATGVQHSADAAAIAADLALPKSTPIYYAVDEDADGLGLLNVALAYIHAAERPDHPGRAYGQYALAEALRKPTFQTYAWSDGQVSKYAALYQWHNSQPLAGGEVDYCEIRDPAALGLITPEDDMTPDQMLDALETPRGQAALQKAVKGFFEVEVDGKTVTRSVDSIVARRNENVTARIDKIAKKVGA